MSADPESPAGEARSGRRAGRSWIKPAATLAIVALALVAGARLLPLGDLVSRLVGWVRATGPAGVAVFALVYVVACVALIPASLLTLAAGFVWGPLWGTALVSPASVLGATLAFRLGRTLGRGWVERKLGQGRLFRAIDQAVAKGGFQVVALLRLSPVIPFNLLNYALSLTRVSTRDFVAGSFVGMLPLTFLYVYLGSLASSLTELVSGRTAPGPAKLVAFAVGLAATVVVTTIVTRRARAALELQVPVEESAGAKAAS